MEDKVYAVLGRVVKDFTDSENILRECGAFIDALIASETKEVFDENLAEMWIKIQSLKFAVNIMEESISKYIAPAPPEDTAQ